MWFFLVKKGHSQYLIPHAACYKPSPTLRTCWEFCQWPSTTICFRILLPNCTLRSVYVFCENILKPKRVNDYVPGHTTSGIPRCRSGLRWNCQAVSWSCNRKFSFYWSSLFWYYTTVMLFCQSPTQWGKEQLSCRNWGLGKDSSLVLGFADILIFVWDWCRNWRAFSGQFDKLKWISIILMKTVPFELLECDSCLFLPASVP